jgi:hypothetical protein
MDDWTLALILKPLVMFVMFGLIVLPLVFAFKRWFPEGRLKRLLLTRISKK